MHNSDNKTIILPLDIEDTVMVYPKTIGGNYSNCTKWVRDRKKPDKFTFVVHEYDAEMIAIITRRLYEALDIAQVMGTLSIRKPKKDTDIVCTDTYNFERRRELNGDMEGYSTAEKQEYLDNEVKGMIEDMNRLLAGYDLR